MDLCVIGWTVQPASVYIPKKVSKVMSYRCAIHSVEVLCSHIINISEQKSYTLVVLFL